MSFKIPELTDNLNVHQNLPDNPALSGSELKKTWDGPVNIIKNYINNILIKNINEEIGDLRKNIYEEEYPISSIKIFEDLEDHSDFLGFKWERVCDGQSLVGYKEGDEDYGEIGKTGGAKSVSLKVENLPPHDHTYSKASATTSNTFDRTFNNTGVIQITNSQTKTGTVGSGKDFKIINTYRVVSIWKRVG